MNKAVYNEEIEAFHPGYYVAEIIDDMGMKQEEFALRMGTTPKTLSLLINGKCIITNDLAQKLATMLGTSVEMWLNLQKSYDEKLIALNTIKEIAAQKDIFQCLDYGFFVRLGLIKDSKSDDERIANLCKYLKLANLNILQNNDFLVSFHAQMENLAEENYINARAWLQVAMNMAEERNLSAFNIKALKMRMADILALRGEAEEQVLEKLQAILESCGVAFIALPAITKARVNGAVKWYSKDKVLLSIDSGLVGTNEFWFVLLHEIKHILQKKLTMTFMNFVDIKDIAIVDTFLDQEADAFAKKWLGLKKE